MPMIIKNKCPCIGCTHLASNVNSCEYWCKRKKQSIVQHHGNGQWMMPCGQDMMLYEEVSEDAGTD